MLRHFILLVINDIVLNRNGLGLKQNMRLLVEDLGCIVAPD